MELESLRARLRLAEGQRDALSLALRSCVSRMESESAWLDKADYPARFMVERHDLVLMPARAALSLVAPWCGKGTPS